MRTRLFLYALILASVVVPPVLSSARAEEGSAGLETLGAAYREAFDAGDAEALAKCFAPDAEYHAPDGDIHRGREAIAKLAAEFFLANPGLTITARPVRTQMLGGHSAVREGESLVRTATGEVFARTVFTAVLVLSGDEWLVASLTEREAGPVRLSAREHLEPLAWLVGDWRDESDHALVRSTCAWSDDGPFLIQKFTVKEVGGETRTATQRIGWDPALGKIRSWTWFSNGGLGGAIWTPVPDGWLLQARGIGADGLVSSATHRIRRKGADLFEWETTQRMSGDELFADESRVIVRRPPEAGVR